MGSTRWPRSFNHFPYSRTGKSSDPQSSRVLTRGPLHAVQIFEVLRSIGGYHSFSAGLIIGGKNLKSERERLNRMNILVATPGRLLQHMDQTFGFDSDNLQMLGVSITEIFVNIDHLHN